MYLLKHSDHCEYYQLENELALDEEQFVHYSDSDK